MSNKVVSWVYTLLPVDNTVDLGVAAAMADEANDDGYVSGQDYGSVVHLAQKTRSHRTTVLRVIADLEELGELLVRRPRDRLGQKNRRPGRHNEYLFVMGRDAAALAEAHGWPKPLPPRERSVRPTYPNDATPEATPSSSGTDQAMDRRADHSVYERESQAAAPANLQEPPSAAVDARAARFSEGSAAPTYPLSVTGRRPVADRSEIERDSEHFPCTPEPKKPAGRAREARFVDDDPLAELAGALSAAGFTVPWDLTLEQACTVLEHLERWPSYAAGVDAFIALVTAQVQARGLPRSAKAWVKPWLEVPAPRPRSVQLPPGPCPRPEHSGEPVGADGTCQLCKTDALVGDR
jgi:hypothetical protein